MVAFARAISMYVNDKPHVAARQKLSQPPPGCIRNTSR